MAFRREFVLTIARREGCYPYGFDSRAVERNKPIPKKKKAVEAEIESLRTENAAYKEHLAIKNRDAGNLFEQLQQAERQGKVNDAAFKMVSDMISAYPDEFDALLKMSRAKKNPSTPFKSNNNGKGGK